MSWSRISIGGDAPSGKNELCPRWKLLLFVPTARGDHKASSGLFVLSDIHNLFDAGCSTVTPDFALEVSRQIRAEFENGRDLYELGGRKIGAPERLQCRPRGHLLQWHNENCFRV